MVLVVHSDIPYLQSTAAICECRVRKKSEEAPMAAHFVLGGVRRGEGPFSHLHLPILESKFGNTIAAVKVG